MIIEERTVYRIGASKTLKTTRRLKKWTRRSGTLKKADMLFSEQIRARDGKCLFPGCKVTDLKKLQCSHYFGRAIKNTRFDPENCITLCWLHHFKNKLLGFEYQKQTKEKHGYDGQYTLFMKKWLRKERFEALHQRSLLHLTQEKAVKRFFDNKIQEYENNLL